MQRSERFSDCRKAQVHGSFRIFEKFINDLRNQPDGRKVAPASNAVHKIETDFNGNSTCGNLTSESKAVLCSANDEEQTKTESDKGKTEDILCLSSVVNTKTMDFTTENKKNIQNEVSGGKVMDFSICEQKERSDEMELKSVSETRLFMTENKENIQSEVSGGKVMDFNFCEQKEISDEMELKSVSETRLFMTENKENIQSEVSGGKVIDFNFCEQKEISDEMELNTVSETRLCTDGDSCEQEMCRNDQKHIAQEKGLEISVVTSETCSTDSQKAGRRDEVTAECSMQDTVSETLNSAQAALQIPHKREPRKEVSCQYSDTHSQQKGGSVTMNVQLCNVDGTKEDSKQELIIMKMITAENATEPCDDLNRKGQTVKRPFIKTKRNKTSNANHSDKISCTVKETVLNRSRNNSMKTSVSRKDTKHMHMNQRDHVLDSSRHRQKLKESDDSKHMTKKMGMKINEPHVRSPKKESSTKHKEVSYKKNASSHRERSVYESLIKAKMKAINKEIKSKAVGLESLSVYDSTVVVDDAAKSAKPQEKLTKKSPYKQYITVRSKEEEPCEELRQYVRCAKKHSDKYDRRSTHMQEHIQKRHSSEEDWEQDLMIVAIDQCESAPSDKHCVQETENYKDVCEGLQHNSIVSDNDILQEPVTTDNTKTGSISLSGSSELIPKPAVGETVSDQLCSEDVEWRIDVNDSIYNSTNSSTNQHTPDSQKDDIYAKNVENKLGKFKANEMMICDSIQVLKEDWESSLIDIDDFNRQSFQEELNEQVVPTQEFTNVRNKESKSSSFQNVWSNERDDFSVEDFWESSLLDVNDIVPLKTEQKFVGGCENVTGFEIKITNTLDRKRFSEEDKDQISRLYLPPPPPVDEVLMCEAEQSSGENMLLSRENELSSGKNKLSSQGNEMSSRESNVSTESNVSSGQNKPTSGENEPSSEGNKLSSGENKPLFGENEPSSEGNKLSSGENKPSSGENKPLSGEKELSSEGNKLSSGESKVSSGENKTSSGEDILSSGVNKLISGENNDTKIESMQYQTESLSMKYIAPKLRLTDRIKDVLHPPTLEKVFDDLMLKETELKRNIDNEVSESEESYLPFSENTHSGVPTNSDFDESVSDGNLDLCVVHSQESSVEEATQKQDGINNGPPSTQTEAAFQDINDSYASDSSSNCDVTEIKEPMQYFHQSPYAHIGEKFGWRTREDMYANYVNTPTGTYKCTCPPAFVKFWIWRSCACNCGEQPMLCDIRNGMDFGMHCTYPEMSWANLPYVNPTCEERRQSDLNFDNKDKRMPYKPRGILGVTFPPPPPRVIIDKMFEGDYIGGSVSTKSETEADGEHSNTPTIPTMPGAYPSPAANTVGYSSVPPGFYPRPSFSIPPPPYSLYSSPQECYLRYCSPYTFHSPPEAYEQKCMASQDRNTGTSAKEPNEQDLHNFESKEIKMPFKKRPVPTENLSKSSSVLQEKNVDDRTSTIPAQHIPRKNIQGGRKLFHGIRFPTLSPTRNSSAQKVSTNVSGDMMTRKILENFTAGHGSAEDSQLDGRKLVDYNLSETDDSEEEKTKLVEEEAAVLQGDNSQDGSESSGDKRKYELEDGELLDDDEDYLTNKKRLVQLSSSLRLTKETEDQAVPRYVPPHKRLSWPQVKDRNLSGVHVKDINKRAVVFADRRKSLGSTNVYTNARSECNMLKQTTPFWSSNSTNTSPLFGYSEPTCLYPAAYFVDSTAQGKAPSSHGYGELHKALTEKRLEKSSDIQWQLKSEEALAKISWQQGSPDMLSSPRQRFLQRSRLLESDSDSGSSNWHSEWKTRFKNRCRTYQGTFVDSHCHLDFLFNRQGFRGSWSKYKEMNEETFPDNYEGCVAVFCFPGSFRIEGLWKDVALEDGVWLAFGCHPKHATEFTPKAEEGLRRCLQNEKVVALGEIGLDYSGIFMQHEAVQKIVFMKQIQIALEINKPLVIHCRQAEEDCLNILERMVPRNYRIHCHCFTGNYESAKKWMDLFPNLYIGLTPLVTFKTAEPTHEVARFIPLERLLLETDAPYFIPRKIPKDEMQFSHPGMAITVAEDVAWYKQCSVSEVLKACRQNTQNMYGI